MPDYKILKTEIDSDPLTRGYSGMTDLQVSDSLNTVNRDNWVPITAAQVYEAVSQSDYDGLDPVIDAADLAELDRIFSLGGDIPTAPGGRVRNKLIGIFGGGSTTITNLAAIANQKRSRGVEIGWGVVTEADVTRAREV